MKRSILAALVFGGFALPLGGAAAADPAKKPSIDELVQFFDTVVFGREFSAGAAPARIKKWNQPLRVVVKEFGETVTLKPQGQQERKLRQRRIKRLHLEYVQKHLNTLASLTGLKTEEASGSTKAANLVINFVPRLQMANAQLTTGENTDLPPVSQNLLNRLASHGGCYFIAWPGSNPPNTIASAVIVVNSSRVMARTDHCILEELTQSLGLPNDADRPWATIFSNYGFTRELSRTDKILIRTLYDRRMKIGMKRDDALKLARVIITELERKIR